MLVAIHAILFPRTKGVLRPIKLPAEKNKKVL